MKARKAQSYGPVAATGARGRHRRVRSPRDEVLGNEALDTPLPGSLLVLLSRLIRSERDKPADDGNAG